jgi:hypothetical protein
MTIKEARFSAVLDFFLSNPAATPTDAATQFGVTRSWMYSMINSDMFKAALYEKRQEISSNVTHTISEDLVGALGLGVQLLTEALEQTTKPEFILDAVDMLSKRYNEIIGVRLNKHGDRPLTYNQQTNVLVADPKDLLRIKEISHKAATIEGKVRTPDVIPAPKEH